MEKEIARFNKNATEEVIVRIVEYYGMDFVDIRAFVKPVIPNDDLRATRKGICIKPENIPVLQNALKNAEEEFKKQKQEEKR